VLASNGQRLMVAHGCASLRLSVPAMLFHPCHLTTCWNSCAGCPCAVLNMFWQLLVELHALHVGHLQHGQLLPFLLLLFLMLLLLSLLLCVSRRVVLMTS